MKKRIAILLGFLAFGLVGYIGGQANEPPNALLLQQLQAQLAILARAQAGRADCACIRVAKGSREIEIGGIQFYLVPVAGSGAPGQP